MAAEGSSRSVREPQNEQEVIEIYQRMQTEVNNIWQKINEMEMELQEHGLVLQTLEPLEKDRKCAPEVAASPSCTAFRCLLGSLDGESTPIRRCFRLIGGVLVERTVGEVAPAVKKNKEGIAEVRQLQIFSRCRNALVPQIEIVPASGRLTVNVVVPQMIGKLETTLAERKTALAAFQAKYKIKMRGEVRPSPSLCSLSCSVK